MKKHELVYRVRVDAPVNEVWAALADFGNVAKCNPSVVESYSTSIEANGVGATRHCTLAVFGASVEERIVGWVDGESMDVDIYETQRFPVVKNVSARLSVESSGEGTTVTGVIGYNLKLGLVGSLMHLLSIRKQTERAWRLFLAGVKEHVETGNIIDRDTRVPVEAVVAA